MPIQISIRHFIVCQSCITGHTIVIRHFPKYDMMHEERLWSSYLWRFIFFWRCHYSSTATLRGDWLQIDLRRIIQPTSNSSEDSVTRPASEYFKVQIIFRFFFYFLSFDKQF